jgi:DNA invertase Pin-like site-specific DNA recombinase
LTRKRRRKPGDPKIAVAIVRVSTDRQDTTAQRTAIETWANATGVQVVAWHEDHGVSGAAALDKRTGLLEALDSLVINGAGVLIAARWDRVARDVVLAAMVERLAERNGAAVVSADGVGAGDGPESMLVRGMMQLLAEYERLLIGHRTRARLAEKRRNGERLGGAVPLGYVARGQRLARKPSEQRAITRARDLRHGGMSYEKIAASLDAEGYKARGQRWYAMTVRRMLGPR